ncbi:hypothetical protein HPB50_020163 [Hyalomma asiaticum]|uniref:Uncharacterized protein n=1 Tax=Hyalomma asiaticum TaxID=266040 RepID=A0ACB7TNB1_HYAAI|nr:hypothetical protein HPB50_020163 [Hyalomma asiaticum]
MRWEECQEDNPSHCGLTGVYNSGSFANRLQQTRAAQSVAVQMPAATPEKHWRASAVDARGLLYWVGGTSAPSGRSGAAAASVIALRRQRRPIELGSRTAPVICSAGC